MGALIFFIHHIATTLQVSHLLERVGRDTIKAVDRLFPDDVGEEATPEQRAAAATRLRGVTWLAVPATRTGYVQRIDADRLVNIAAAHDSVIRLDVHIGEFVIDEMPIASIANQDNGSPARDEPTRGSTVERDNRSIAACFAVGTFRTIDEDAGFGVRQIVDVALKALSPGVNDTTTAVTCVDWLSAILVRLANRRIETPFRSKAGVVRVIASGPTFESMFTLAVDEIRQNAAANVTVLGALLAMAGRVGRVVRDPERRTLLEAHVALIAEHVERRVEANHDREWLRRCARIALADGAASGESSA
jgi:uncharacterized membrane protein